MGLEYRIRAALHAALTKTLSSPVFPITRYFPRGISWPYDIQRFAGTSRLDVIFDVGANTGQTAWSLVRYFPQASIFCFEPVRASFAELESQYGNKVKCLKLALGSKAEQKEIRLRYRSGWNSLLSSDPNADHYTGKSEVVSVSTVDLVCAKYNVRSIDVLKMDVQGWELEVLHGANGILRENKVHFVLSEAGFGRDDNEIERVPFADLDAALVGRGFSFCGLYDAHRFGRMKEFTVFANALYLNPNFRV